MKQRHRPPVASFKATAATCCAVALLLFSAGSALGFDIDDYCANFSAPDHTTRTGGQGRCLALKTLESGKPLEGSGKSPFVVVLHGDAQGRMNRPVYEQLADGLAENTGLRIIVMARPGYRTAFGASDGVPPYYDDDYTLENVSILAYAINRLREYYDDAPVILLGHSGGAAMAALVMALHPGVASGALLLGCPCDIKPWRQWRHTHGGWKANWPNSLSPIEYARSISVSAPLIALVGQEDTVTPPWLTQSFVETLRANGHHLVSSEVVPSATHGALLFNERVLDSVRKMAAQLNANQRPRQCNSGPGCSAGKSTQPGSDSSDWSMSPFHIDHMATAKGFGQPIGVAD